MLPSIALVNSVQTLRDGGSLCASFQGSNGAHYWLVIPVEIEAGSGKILGYACPLIVERSFAPTEITLSWEHARVLIDQIERVLSNKKFDAAIQTMYAVIESRGKVIK